MIQAVPLYIYNIYTIYIIYIYIFIYNIYIVYIYILYIYIYSGTANIAVTKNIYYIYILYDISKINSSKSMIAIDLWFVPLECSRKGLFFCIFG